MSTNSGKHSMLSIELFRKEGWFRNKIHRYAAFNIELVVVVVAAAGGGEGGRGELCQC